MFQSTPARERATVDGKHAGKLYMFQSTPARERATGLLAPNGARNFVSIHARA